VDTLTNVYISSPAVMSYSGGEKAGNLLLKTYKNNVAFTFSTTFYFSCVETFFPVDTNGCTKLISRYKSIFVSFLHKHSCHISENFESNNSAGFRRKRSENFGKVTRNIIVKLPMHKPIETRDFNLVYII
jgi:hypothetical protein